MSLERLRSSQSENLSDEPTPAEASRREFQNRESSTEEKWQCPNCTTLFGDKHDQCWLECSICLDHYDTDCLRMPKKHWQSINARTDIQWLCPTCVKKYLPDPNAGLKLVREVTGKSCEKTEGEKEILWQINKIEKLQESLKQKITETNKSVENKLNRLDYQTSDLPERIKLSLNDTLDKVPEKIEDNISKWSDLFKTTTTK